VREKGWRGIWGREERVDKEGGGGEKWSGGKRVNEKIGEVGVERK
jgi:hypothetical protein